jgi:hypothetical protein
MSDPLSEANIQEEMEKQVRINSEKLSKCELHDFQPPDSKSRLPARSRVCVLCSGIVDASAAELYRKGLDHGSIKAVAESRLVVGENSVMLSYWRPENILGARRFESEFIKGIEEWITSENRRAILHNGEPTCYIVRIPYYASLNTTIYVGFREDRITARWYDAKKTPNEIDLGQALSEIMPPQVEKRIQEIFGLDMHMKDGRGREWNIITVDNLDKINGIDTFEEEKNSAESPKSEEEIDPCSAEEER